MSNPCVDIQRKRIEERLPNSRMPFPLPIRAFTSIDYTAPEIYTRGLWTKTERLTQTSMPTFSVLLQTFLSPLNFCRFSYRQFAVVSKSRKAHVTEKDSPD